jgi:hypothetical protein
MRDGASLIESITDPRPAQRGRKTSRATPIEELDRDRGLRGGQRRALIEQRQRIPQATRHDLNTTIEGLLAIVRAAAAQGDCVLLVLQRRSRCPLRHPFIPGKGATAALPAVTAKRRRCNSRVGGLGSSWFGVL